MKRATDDPVLRAKVSALESLLEAFCPDVNASFWDSGRLR